MKSSSMTSNSTWRILGVSVTGTSHHKSGRGCDDDNAYRQLKNGTLLMAVADGAGSAPRSAEGASTAVRAAIKAAEAALSQQTEPSEEKQWEEMLSTLLKVVRASIEELASGRTASSDIAAVDAAEETQNINLLPLREFATTLLLTIVTSQWVAIAQVGDGAIVIQYADGILQALTKPDHGEYLNETSFITDSSYPKQVQYKVLQVEIQGVALLSDGLQMLALDSTTNKPYEPFFTPLFRFAANADATEAELTALLESERVCARTDDDKTLVLAVRL